MDCHWVFLIPMWIKLDRESLKQMRPTLRQLEYLVAIADTGKFGDAAKRMNVSQPSLSTQVADMEAYLGASLVERGRKGAMMTAIGADCVARARLVLRQVEDLKTLARQGDDILAGNIRLGVLPTIGPYLLPAATKRLHDAYPELRISVSEARTIDLDVGLRTGRLDVIISTAKDHPELASVYLCHETLWVCTADDDPLSQDKSPIRIDELKGKSLLTLGPGHRLSSIIGELARIAGAHISSEYTGTSLDATRQTATMGGGVAVLPSLYALSEARRDPDLIVRRIDHEAAQRDIHLCWRESSPLAKKFQTLGEELSNIASELSGE